MSRLLSLIAYVILLFAPAAAADAGSDLADALVPWKTDCTVKGCLMGVDVLRGISGLPTPPDRADLREYISIYVAVNRNLRKVEFFAFHVDPRAAKDQGIVIGFTHSSGDGKNYKIWTDKELTNLPFERCSQESCVARAVYGFGNDPKVDLTEKFLNSSHLWLMYMKDGHPYRTLILLSSFKKEYQRILATEFEQK